jgi:hypothetical protein
MWNRWNRNTPIGTRLGDVVPRPSFLDFKIADVGLAVGDLVTYSLTSYSNGMTLYRIEKDCKPDCDLTWMSCHNQASRWSSSLTPSSRLAWVRPGTRTPVPDVRVRGCIEIVPVLQFFPSSTPLKKRTVSYQAIRRVQKVDVIALGKSFSTFQDFINQEIRRLTGA